jgi:nucleoside permease NupC
MLETEQRRVEQVSQQVEQLKAENQMLRKWLDQAEKGYTHTYSFLLKVLLIIIVVAALITILIEFVFKY